MGRLADGFLTTQLLYVAARLGVADVLAHGPRTGAELAAAVTADPDLLTRALRGLVLEEDGRFALTDLGRCLRADAPGSMRGPVLARARSTTRPRPGRATWSPPTTSAVVEQARRRLAAAGVADRCQLVPGDFFAEVPPGADAYLLSRVLHDWTDGDALVVLAACHAAMGPASRLPVVEAILPERAADQPAVIRMGLHMLVLLGARERTEAQFRRLLAGAGFEVRRVVPTRSPAGLSVIEAVPASTRR